MLRTIFCFVPAVEVTSCLASTAPEHGSAFASTASAPSHIAAVPLPFAVSSVRPRQIAFGTLAAGPGTSSKASAPGPWPHAVARRLSCPSRRASGKSSRPCQAGRKRLRPGVPFQREVVDARKMKTGVPSAQLIEVCPCHRWRAVLYLCPKDETLSCKSPSACRADGAEVKTLGILQAWCGSETWEASSTASAQESLASNLKDARIRPCTRCGICANNFCHPQHDVWISCLAGIS